MAIIKCKMCGGDIELTADKTFGTCEFCGSTMTLPKVDDDQRAAAFNRGNHFRRIGEFDKALAVYERIVREDDTDAEAHWCCALCRFGIEYVEDPGTFEWLPTCHRASFDNFLEDVDYLAAVEHSSGITRRQYQKDAAKIAEVQRGILATSQNAEPYDVFICYKESDENGDRTRDSLLAQDIYYQLTEQGRKVFFSRITLEDMVGTQYEPFIFAALNSAKVMIAIGTKAEYMNAVWVKNEWSRFLAMMKKDRSKILLPCYRDMDPYDMPEQLSVLQSYDMGKIGFIQDLTRGIAKVLDANKKPETVKETVVVQQAVNNNVTALLKRGNMALEDGEWQKADEFFEEVLNQDAECAEAYLGKALAQEKCKNLDAFVQHRQAVTQNSQAEMLHYAPNTAHVEQKLQQYSLPRFVDPNAISKCYECDTTYPSHVASRQQQYDNELAYWKNHKWLSKAEKFADDALAKVFAAKKAVLISVLSQRREDAVKEEDAAMKRSREAYARHLQQADAKAEKLYQYGIERREAKYQECVELAQSSSSPVTLRNTAGKLEQLGDYKDSKHYAELCRQRSEEIQEQTNTALIKSLRKSIESATTRDNLEKCLTQLESMRFRPDGEALIQRCHERIHQLQEQQVHASFVRSLQQEITAQRNKIAALQQEQLQQQQTGKIGCIIALPIYGVFAVILSIALMSLDTGYGIAIANLIFGLTALIIFFVVIIKGGSQKKRNVAQKQAVIDQENAKLMQMIQKLNDATKQNLPQ